MAKQTAGIMGGFCGTIGPVIGYQWRGRWCMRARPRSVANPRTEAQQEHRMLFRDMVQTAGHLTAALRYGMRQASLEQGLTEGNLFVRMNKHCFTPQGIDYSRLALSTGPVAPVGFGTATLDAHGTLHVEFERNPQRMKANSHDRVFVAVYCPERKETLLAAPVARHSKRVALALPDEWLGRQLHVWGFVQDHMQRASECQYITLADSGAGQNDNKQETFDYEKDNSVYTGRHELHGGMEPTGDRLGMEGRREDGDADARRRGAGGSGADAEQLG